MATDDAQAQYIYLAARSLGLRLQRTKCRTGVRCTILCALKNDTN